MKNVALFSEKMDALHVPEDSTKILDETSLSTTRWINLAELKQKFKNETLKEEHLNKLITTLERLVEMPYSYKAKDFIFE